MIIFSSGLNSLRDKFLDLMLRAAPSHPKVKPYGRYIYSEAAADFHPPLVKDIHYSARKGKYPRNR